MSPSDQQVLSCHFSKLFSKGLPSSPRHMFEYRTHPKYSKSQPVENTFHTMTCRTGGQKSACWRVLWIVLVCFAVVVSAWAFSLLFLSLSCPFPILFVVSSYLFILLTPSYPPFSYPFSIIFLSFKIFFTNSYPFPFSNYADPFPILSIFFNPILYIFYFSLIDLFL